MEFLIGGLIIVFPILYIYYYHKKKKKKEQIKWETTLLNQKKNRLAQEEERRIDDEARKNKNNIKVKFFLDKERKIKSAVKKFNSELDFSSYFNFYKAQSWILKYSPIYNEMLYQSHYNIGLSKELELLISTFFINFTDVENIRKKYNEEFLKRELNIYNTFFSSIEDRSLDIQQRKAIITDEDNNLIIAGAGSGKTSTIVGKVSYLKHKFNMDAKDILLISFTRSSAFDLSKRIAHTSIQAHTFHKFATDVIRQVEGRLPSIFEVEQYIPTITKEFKALLIEPVFSILISTYFLDYLKIYKPQFEFKTQGEYIQYLKDFNFKPYKKILIDKKGLQSLNFEIVKSIEECKIANYLLVNNIDYDYELPYPFDQPSENYKQYKPDFTIRQGNKTVYLEHFGIAKNGDVPSWFIGKGSISAKDSYHNSMKYKRELHSKNNTTLIETYSYQMSDGTLFSSLSKKLTDAGIVLKPKSPLEIIALIENTAPLEFKSFIETIGTFITLLKSNNHTLISLKAKIKKNDPLYARYMAFLNIVEPLFERYQKYLNTKNEIDFSDMINKACSYIIKKNYKIKLKYIIVDEFQDLSIGRYKFLKALLDTNPTCKLYCVGDDWQSIYRFSGSDISLFADFEKYFGKTKKSPIEKTYRFQNPLIDMSANFILKNPNQSKKVLVGADSDKSTTFKIVTTDEELKYDIKGISGIFEELLSDYQDLYTKKIIVIGRYNFDLNRLISDDNVLSVNQVTNEVSYYSRSHNCTVYSKFLTAHKSKGLEADIVIMLNCNAGSFGFPSDLTDDPVLGVLLSSADQYPNGEERRLFYVAMTRAKERLYFITNIYNKSKFITEIESSSDGTTKCPLCENADVVWKSSGISSKTGQKFNFYGCTNFEYGCLYSDVKFID